MMPPTNLRRLLKKPTRSMVLACIFLLVLGWFIWFFRTGSSEPVYGGLKLSSWLDGSTVIHTSPAEFESTARQMGDVIRAVGPEALPWLVCEVERTGNRLTDYYARLWGKSALLKSCLPKPSPNPRLEIAGCNSMNILERLAPGSPYESKALRAVIAAHLEGNRDFYDCRLRVLGSFTNFPNKVIPILLPELNNPVHVETAINSLQKFGSSATPSLYPLALKETGLIRPAELALEKADMRAYSRLRDEKARLGIQ